jgi:hypothetical protein
MCPPWSAPSATRPIKGRKCRLIGNRLKTQRLHFYISASPGRVLALSVHGFNLIGDALSPRQR